MDDKFVDRMQELADLTPEVLERRWETVVAVANSTDDATKVRLVLIACGVKVDHEADEWFWQPFRAQEPNFKVENGKALHTQLAHAATRYLVTEESDVQTAIAVRLAHNAGLKPRHQDLIDESVDCLVVRDAGVPTPKQYKSFWTTGTKEAFAANPGDPDTLAAPHHDAQAVVNALVQYVNSLTLWAQAADKRFTSDQRLIEWLLTGARADGRGWSTLSPGVVAVDAAREMASLLVDPPQLRHEAMLLQVLAVAGHEDTPLNRSVKVSTGGGAPPGALAPVTPILGVVAAGKGIPKRKPSELAIRTLWEARATAIWNGQ
jgi:hypothetical protein